MLEAIMNDIRTIWLQFGWYNVYLVAGITFLFVILQSLLYAFGHGILTKPNPISTIIWFMLTLFYLFFVLDLTLLNREAGSRFDVSLKLFGTIHPDPVSRRYVLENALLFIPFGICIPSLLPRIRKWPIVLLSSALLSVTIEVTQYITKRGYFQIDDIWLNIFGAMLGYGLLELLSVLIERIIKT